MSQIPVSSDVPEGLVVLVRESVQSFVREAQVPRGADLQVYMLTEHDARYAQAVHTVFKSMQVSHCLYQPYYQQGDGSTVTCSVMVLVVQADGDTAGGIMESVAEAIGWSRDGAL